MYVMRTHGYDGPLGYNVTRHIFEMTAKELREHLANEEDKAKNIRYRRITPADARYYIREQDVIHSTGLWHDGERWRYARADETGC